MCGCLLIITYGIDIANEYLIAVSPPITLKIFAPGYAVSHSVRSARITVRPNPKLDLLSSGIIQSFVSSEPSQATRIASTRHLSLILFLFVVRLMMKDDDAGQSPGTIPNRKMVLNTPPEKSHEPTRRIRRIHENAIRTSQRGPIQRTQLHPLMFFCLQFKTVGNPKLTRQE